MEQQLNILGVIAIMATVLSGCTAIGDIFKAGVWSGIIVVVVVIALIIFLISKFTGKK